MKLKFCGICDNLLYISVAPAKRSADDDIVADDGGSGAPFEMHYVCKNCGDTQKATAENGESICVLETRIGEDEAGDYKRFMTPYLKYDPTLPRVSHIVCPNPGCAKGIKGNVIVVKYDKTDMRYLYCCEGCDTFWRTGEAPGAAAPATAPAAAPKRQNAA